MMLVLLCAPLPFNLPTSPFGPSHPELWQGMERNVEVEAIDVDKLFVTAVLVFSGCRASALWLIDNLRNRKMELRPTCPDTTPPWPGITTLPEREKRGASFKLPCKAGLKEMIFFENV